MLDARHDVARLDQDHLHAEGVQLEAQRIAHGFEGELAAAVSALRRRGHETGDGAHHHDAAALSFAHVRHNGLSYAQDTEKIRLELAPPVLHSQVFDSSAEVYAGIIDEEVDGARFFKDASHSSLDGCVIADVQFERFKRQLFLSSQRIELGPFFRRTSSCENAIAALRKQKRRGSAQAVRCAGD